MLQAISDRTQTWVSWVLVILLSLAFGLWGIGYYLNNGHHSNVVVTVDGQAINQQAVDNAYHRIRDKRRQHVGPSFVMTEAMQKRFEQQALLELVFNAILDKATAKAGFSIPSEQLELAVYRNPLFQLDGHFSSARFQGLLQANYLTQADYFKAIRMQMLINQLQMGFTETAFVLPNAVNGALKLINQTRDIDYFQVPITRFLSAAAVPIKPAAIETFYQAHKKQFMVPEKLSVQYVVLSVAALLKQQVVSASDAKQFYQRNPGSYTIPAKWQLVKVGLLGGATPEAQARFAKFKQLLQSGVSPAALIKALPAAQQLKMAPGLRSAFQLPHALQASIEQYSKVASWLPAMTEGGQHIAYYLKAYQAPQLQPFAKVQSQVQQRLARQQAEEHFSALSNQLSNLTYANPSSLTVAAKQLRLPIQKTPLFTRDGDGLARDAAINQPSLLAAAFSDSVLTDSNNSAVIGSTSGHQAIVLRVAKHVAAHARPLAEVRDQITKALQKAHAFVATKQLTEQVVAGLQQGDSEAALAKRYQITFSHHQALTLHDTVVPSQLVRKAFQLSPPPAKGTHWDVFKMGDNYAGLGLQAVHYGKAVAQTSQAFKGFEEELTNTAGQLTYELFLQGLLDEAKIEPQAMAKRLRRQLAQVG